jgi:hypothetical protein
MPIIDPVARFWIGVVVTVAIAVTGGTLSFSHLIPTDWIPTATQLCAWIAFIGSALLTALNGMATSAQSRIASAAAVPEVGNISTTKELADASPSPKVTNGVPKP